MLNFLIQNSKLKIQNWHFDWIINVYLLIQNSKLMIQNWKIWTGT